jgi:hypothetical protein
LVAVLSPRYGLGAATGIVLVTRLAVTLGEALAVGVIWLTSIAWDGVRRIVGVSAGA